LTIDELRHRNLELAGMSFAPTQPCCGKELSARTQHMSVGASARLAFWWHKPERETGKRSKRGSTFLRSNSAASVS
jgi:hypothetical protein